MSNSSHVLRLATVAALGLVGLLGAQDSLPRPLPIYFLEFETDIKGESHSVAEDITQALATAFNARRRSFRLLDKTESRRN
jgi:hypothetical protein